MTHGYFQTVAGADDTSVGYATELKWELDEDRVHCVFFVSFRSEVEPSWGDRGSSIWGCLLLFWFRSQTLIVFWMMYV